tara:strand:+ start:546 stop:671 length:126 start_codon:yes stop_codon:yes gene_type:complete
MSSLGYFWIATIVVSYGAGLMLGYYLYKPKKKNKRRRRRVY